MGFGQLCYLKSQLEPQSGKKVIPAKEEKLEILFLKSEQLNGDKPSYLRPIFISRRKGNKFTGLGTNGGKFLGEINRRNNCGSINIFSNCGDGSVRELSPGLAGCQMNYNMDTRLSIGGDKPGITYSVFNKSSGQYDFYELNASYLEISIQDIVKGLDEDEEGNITCPKFDLEYNVLLELIASLNVWQQMGKPRD